MEVQEGEVAEHWGPLLNFSSSTSRPPLQGAHASWGLGERWQVAAVSGKGGTWSPNSLTPHSRSPYLYPPLLFSEAWAGGRCVCVLDPQGVPALSKGVSPGLPGLIAKASSSPTG